MTHSTPSYRSTNKSRSEREFFGYEFRRSFLVPLAIVFIIWTSGFVRNLFDTVSIVANNSAQVKAFSTRIDAIERDQIAKKASDERQNELIQDLRRKVENDNGH